MDEQNYLNTPLATVTSARIVIGAQTFATRNVGSVSIKELAKPSGPVWAMLIGGLIALPLGDASGGRITFGLALLAWGIYRWIQPVKLQLVLIAGGGTTIALTTDDKRQITELHDAIVQAIAAR